MPSKLPLIPSAIVAASLAVTGSTYGQCTPAAVERGSFHSLPAAFLRQVSTSADIELTASAGIGGTPVVPPTPPSTYGLGQAPDYRKSVMFPDDLTWLEIDAISTGNDNIGTDSNGNINLGLSSQGWAVITFSLTSGSPGPAGSVIEARRLDPCASHGGDLYSFGVDGSQNVIPDEYVNAIWLEHAGEDLDINSPPTDLVAHDYQAGLLAENNGTPDPHLVPNGNLQFYFSISPAAAASFNALVGNGTVPTGSRFASLGTLDAATIYLTTFDPVQGSWSDVTVAHSSAELGLSDFEEDIDAIMIGSSVIFSTTSPSRNELMVRVVQNNSITTVPLRDPTGKLMTQAMGLNQSPGASRDNVDALCGIDPETVSFSNLIGTPVDAPFGINPSMTMSMSRFHFPGQANPAEVMLSLSGWGNTGANNANVVVHILQGVSWGANGLSLQNATPLLPQPIVTGRSATEFNWYLQLPLPSTPGTYLVMLEFVGPGLQNSWSQACIMKF